MPYFICTTCGTQYAESTTPPERCIICTDERQYVSRAGQGWTTLDALRETHYTVVHQHEPGLTGIGTEPKFCIGQRPLLVESESGGVLWDCMTLIDDHAIDAVNQRGGLRAIAISHPHYYSAMVEWSHAFDSVPVYLHADDREWVTRPDPALVFWEGETLDLGEGLTLIRCGGHFPGSTVLHWPQGADGRGALLTGDTIHAVPDPRYVSFMYSFPNLVPLAPSAVERVVAAVQPYAFDRIYGAWFDTITPSDAKAAVARSALRYTSRIRERIE